MTSTAFFWIGATIFWTAIMSFYGMQEMACISFNRLRLEFQMRLGSTRAKYIHTLLSRPTLLFGTTLIGVNVALVLSSESIRQCFCAMGLNPNWSVFVHIPYVAIFGDLIPLYAARLFPEHIARLGIWPLWITSRILSPLTYSIDWLFRTLRTVFLSKQQQATPPHVQRGELQALLEKQGPSQEMLVSRLFALRDIPVAQLMTPLNSMTILSSSLFCGPAKKQLMYSTSNTILIRNSKGRIIGYLTIWDILTASAASSLGQICHHPIYISDQVYATDAMLSLKNENSRIALLIDSSGDISGVISLNNLLAELSSKEKPVEQLFHIKKSIAADILVHDFIKKYRVPIQAPPQISFAELIEQLLGRQPSLQDIVYFGPLELTVKEVGLRGAKTILVTTL